jgi:acyl-CoA hydrolase
MNGVARPLVVYGDGPGGPLIDPRRLAAVGRLTDPEIVLGWVVRDPGWLDEVDVPVTSLLTSLGVRRAVAAGRVRTVPARLSALPSLLAGRLRPEVAVVGAVADGAGWRSIASVGWAPTAARLAREVVIERWPDDAALPGAPPIEGNVVEIVERVEGPDPLQVVAPSDAERTIAAHVAGLLPEGATIQWGPGTLGAAFVDAVSVPVGVHSGVVTDELVGLVERGLLVGTAESAYLWGGPALSGLVSAGRLRLAPVERTHDLVRLGALAGLVAVNTALEVGLDGAVNVERVGDRIVSGPGGHPDFCLGASRAPGGMSVIALRSTAGARSGVVARPTMVSTPRTDVDIVVTEHGVADLRGLDDAARAEALIAVADPAHRDALRAAR